MSANNNWSVVFLYMQKILIVCLLCFLSKALFSKETVSEDPLAADSMAAKYRTGEIDPAVAEIPEHIRTNIFIKPEIYLKELVSFFAQDADNDYHIVKRIHDWITDSITYQFDGDRRINIFLKTRRTNCSGYSALFKKMAEYAGISSSVVVGYSKTYLYENGKQGEHAWNLVRIDGKKYLVDITHDKRQRVRDGEAGEKGPYSDLELFIHPSHKILINLPYNKKYQLLDTPITYKEYMKPPRIRLAFVKYGLEFVNPRFPENIIEAHYQWPDSGITGLFDGIMTKGRSHRLTIECPENVEIDFRVGTFGDTYPNHAHSYRRGKHVILLFSAPDKGSFMATVLARFIGQDEWERAYSFILVEETGKEPEV